MRPRSAPAPQDLTAGVTQFWLSCRAAAGAGVAEKAGKMPGRALPTKTPLQMS